MTTKKVGIELKVGAVGTEQLAAVSKGLAGAGDEAKLLQAKSAELQGALQRLQDQQGLIDAFVRQKAAVGEASKALADAQSTAQRYGREMADVEAPTKRQTAAFAQARDAARGAEQAFQEQQVKLQQLRGQLDQSGISTTNLATAQVRLRQEQAGVQQQVAATTDWAQRMATAQRNAGAASTDMATQGRRAATALQEQAAAAGAAEPKLNAITGAARNLAAVGVAGILGSQTARLLGDVAQTADAFANLQARVKLVTGEGEAFNAAWQGISEISLRTNSNLETTAVLFGKVAEAGKALGLSQQAALSVTETINQAVQLSGASAASSAAAVQQLVQGLQSGVLRGDEFNSVMEQAPRLARALADALGVSTGELRKMAEAGELSADKVIQSLQGQSAVLQKEFGTLPVTIGRALENLNTKWTLFVGNLNTTTGATKAVAGSINALAENLDEIAGMATRGGAVLVAALAVQGVGALRALATQAVASAGSMALLTTQINKIPTTINIVVAAVGLEVGYRIGEMLYENSELARKLGVAVSAFFVNLVSDLQLLAESAKAVFTDDTVGAAFDRYLKRGKELDRIFGELWDGAERSPATVRAAAEKAEKALKGLGDKGGEAGNAVAAGGHAAAGGIAGATKAIDTAVAAIDTLVAAGNAKLPQLGQVAEEQAAALGKLVDKGAEGVQLFAKALPEAIEKLSAAELEQFRARMVGAFEAAGTAAKRAAQLTMEAGEDGSAYLRKADQAAQMLRAGLDAVGRQAAKSLGVDLAAASNTVTAEFTQQQQALATLVRALPTLAKAGVDTGQVVRQALSKMIDSARNQAEIDAVIQRMDSLGVRGREAGDMLAKGLDQRIEAAKTGDVIEALRRTVELLGGQGRLSGTQVTDALDKIGRKADEILPGVQSVAEAAKLLGVQTSAALKRTADEYSQAWALIRNSTEIGLAAKITAFNKYHDAAVAANGGVETSQLKLDRQILNTQANTAGLGREFDKAMTSAGEATDRTRGRVRALGDEAMTATDRVMAAQRALDAYGPGANGGLASLGGSQAARNAEVKSTTANPQGVSDYNPWGVRSDVDKAPASGTIGSVQTPPPDNSGDYEWVIERNVGSWQFSAAGAARRQQAVQGRNNVIREAYRRAGLSAPGEGTNAGMNMMGLPDAVREQLQFSAAGPTLRPAVAPAPAPTSAPVEAPAPQPAAQPGPAPSPTPPPATPSSTVTINLPGMPSVTGQFAPDQVALLEAMLRELATSGARTSGPPGP